MYYEEQIINGVLMFRTNPSGDWQQCSIEKMSQRIVKIDAEVKELKIKLAKSQNEAEERGYLMGKKYEKERMISLLGLSS
jgi:hypothetical protein